MCRGNRQIDNLFLFDSTPPTRLYTLSLHDALPISAASIWNVGVVGAAVGFGYYDLGLILALTNFLVLTVLTPLKDNPGEPSKNEAGRSEEHTSELQSQFHLVCRLLLEKKKIKYYLFVYYIVSSH